MDERVSPARGISSFASHPPAGGTVTLPAPHQFLPMRGGTGRAIRAEAPHFLCPARERKALSCCFSISPSCGVFELGLAGEVVGASEEGERLGAALDHLPHPPASRPGPPRPSPCLQTSGQRALLAAAHVHIGTGAQERGPCVFYHYHSYQRHFYVLCAKYLT